MQQITDTAMTITPSEYGSQVVLTNMMLLESKDDFKSVAQRILRDSFDRQQDEVLVDDFSSFSIDNGAAAAALTLGEVMAMHASIKYNAPADGTAGRGGEPAPDPTYGVFTPAQIHDIRQNMVGGLGASAATQNAPEMERLGGMMLGGSFTIDGIGGLTIHSDININKDTNDDAVGAIKSSEAHILVELDGGPDIEPEYDASLRAWEFNIVGKWARGEYDDDWGRAGTYDSALPVA